MKNPTPKQLSELIDEYFKSCDSPVSCDGEPGGGESPRGGEKARAGILRINADKINDLSVVLYMTAVYISGGESGSVYMNREKTEQQQQINEYIQGIKAKLLSEGQQGYISYPYEKEKQLYRAIITGNLAEAREFLNEILGHIFFSSANNLGIIKVRAMELAVMVSRAALDSGADANNIFNLNMRFIAEFFNLSSIEDVCWALTDMLRKFSEETFDFSEVKHIELLSKAVSYIKTNYMNKITLEDVASHVFLSASYFSKIFKEEMHCHFNEYLNNTRIEKSKLLLLAGNLSIIEISELSGFYDQSYFNKVFKKVTGMTPKKYRDNRLAGNI